MILVASFLSTASHPMISDDTPIVFDQQLLNFNSKALDRHNFYRAQHSVSPIALNAKLATLAQRVALASAKAGRLQTNRPIYSGVTLGAMYASTKGYPKNFGGDDLTDMWYNSKDTNGTRNYGQLIWKSTKQAGFGFCKSADGQVFFVGLYYPPGNIIGFEEENIFPLVKKQSKTGRLLTNSRLLSMKHDSAADHEENDEVTPQSILNEFFLTILSKLNEIKIEPELASRGIEWIDKISKKLVSLKNNLIKK